MDSERKREIEAAMAPVFVKYGVTRMSNWDEVGASASLKGILMMTVWFDSEISLRDSQKLPGDLDAVLEPFNMRVCVSEKKQEVKH